MSIHLNRGIVVGTVRHPDGRPAAGAYVLPYRIDIGNGKLYMEKFDAYSDSAGRFRSAFLWSGTNFGDDLSTPPEITMIARIDKGDSTHSWFTEHTKQRVRGYIARDILHPINIASGNPFSSISDLADFAIGLGSALSNYRNLVPIWKVSQVGTTEGYVMGAGVDLYLWGSEL